MGNCMERWKEGGGERRERERGPFKVDGGGGGMKVKIVLTRHELEMFLLQYDGKLMMSNDVIGELEKKIKPSSSMRPSSMPWKPSLDSIVECPEIQEMDR
ncbi:PREDICTED: uncharacterized protein LOC104817601 [Tarenaya hassleriana]|uniref:uncharacterized protein LOC104817601 n=1 Tax=Tarenaya hassleriana TaxID=28532 RepID=UPI00053C619E|nr:PREDICTED: uncharacterized protein LOC104817601 [Tarenaya hassleriana]